MTLIPYDIIVFYCVPGTLAPISLNSHSVSLLNIKYLSDLD